MENNNTRHIEAVRHRQLRIVAAGNNPLCVISSLTPAVILPILPPPRTSGSRSVRAMPRPPGGHFRPQISGLSTSGSANVLVRQAEDTLGKGAGEGGGGRHRWSNACTTNIAVYTGGQTRIRPAERYQ